ncbi:putative hercynylcysteine sulfoxide lyase [Nocardioides psychrotolerans]|uniref:Pyridoxal 5-phosphate dependent beta-lyase n=1 Tax=Nocardioides psychrotolerans TaxID=1005945 RepID=A0A1I3FQ47_9ACTN|nr:aminotransferase class V-fold PLP-dependent enzyme [Nocardioides psychrotolerans]GEP37248.1 putative hercynylcysteine sulfoxide lyase [Nocardioides psychrotolerans]SFI13247.1 pyridoxal 5-phosphate dependent beta-lyase [Nocardioides psychrotolerans]
MTDLAGGGVVHLDSAAAGRMAPGTIEAIRAHLHREALRGAYVAEEEAGEGLTGLRRDLAGLFGVPDDGVALVESGTTALQALIDSWPLRPGDRVGIAPSEWGPNLEAFEAAGAVCVPLAVDADGAVDTEALRVDLEGLALTLVHVDQVTSHRSLVQPVAELVAACTPAGVPVWVDAAQALGHRELSAGVAAAYATSRKWLRGPRGVGMLAVASEHWDRLRVRPQRKHPGAGPVRLLESGESNVAGRIGLAVAVRDYLAAGPREVESGLDLVGDLTREHLADVPGWSVVLGRGAITALRPTAGQDVSDVRQRLLDQHGILTTASLPWRAPRDPVEPTLRLSPHLDCTLEDLARVAAALR